MSRKLTGWESPCAVTHKSPAIMAWFLPADYLRLRGLLDDGDDLPAMYEQWQRIAHRDIVALSIDGYAAHPVVVTSDELADYCAIHNLVPNLLVCEIVALERAEALRIGRR
jgi:hypothetical protein